MSVNRIVVVNQDSIQKRDTTPRKDVPKDHLTTLGRGGNGSAAEDFELDATAFEVDERLQGKFLKKKKTKRKKSRIFKGR